MSCFREVRIQHDLLYLWQCQDAASTLYLYIWVIYGLSTPELKMSQSPA